MFQTIMCQLNRIKSSKPPTTEENILECIPPNIGIQISSLEKFEFQKLLFQDEDDIAKEL